MLMRVLKRLVNERRESRFLKGIENFDFSMTIAPTVNCGRGVFATRQIVAGTLLGVYPGRMVSIEEFFEKDEFAEKALRYAYYFSEDTIIDPTDLFGAVASIGKLGLALVNEPPRGKQANVAPICSTRYLWFVAIRDIQPGEELLTTYGATYRRDYETDLIESSGNLTLTTAEREVLLKAGIKHSWLREGIKAFLSSSAQL